MSKIIKVLDNNLIEIADYRCPEVIFKNNVEIPPILQDVKNEIEHLECYCVFKETINPFELYAQNEKYKIVLDKIKENIERTIEIIKQQPTEDDTWILERLNSNLKILEEIEWEIE